jgi:hypothetical protein
MFKKIITVFIISSFASTVFACKTPSPKQLSQFFGEHANWKTFGAQLNLVFSNYKRSSLNSPIKGNATITQVCLRGSSLRVVTTRGEATVSRTGNHVYVMPSTGGKYTFSPASFEPFAVDESFVIRERFPRARYESDNLVQTIFNPAAPQSNSGAIDI